MALEVVWSPEALEDIELIAAYIERGSVRYARAVVEKLVDATRTLAEHPEMGRIVPEFDNAAIRERFVYSYRLIYRHEPDRVQIVAVVHGRRLLDAVSDRL